MKSKCSKQFINFYTITLSAQITVNYFHKFFFNKIIEWISHFEYVLLVKIAIVKKDYNNLICKAYKIFLE